MKGSFFVILATFLWAIDTLIRYPMVESGLAVKSIVFLEHVFLCLVFSLVIFRFPFKKLKTKNLASFFVIGSMGSALGTLAFTQAFAYINPSIVILLQKFQPVIALVLARLILKETLSKKFYAFALVCLVGAIVMSMPDLRGLMNSAGEAWWEKEVILGYALSLFAVVSWGASTVFGKRLENEGYSHTQVMAGRFFFGLLALVAFTIDPDFSLPRSSEVYFKIVLLVILSGVLGMYFYYRGLKLIPAKLSALSEMFFALFAVVLNWAVLGKALGGAQILGGALLVLGALGAQRVAFKGEHP